MILAYNSTCKPHLDRLICEQTLYTAIHSHVLLTARAAMYVMIARQAWLVLCLGLVH